MAAVVRGALSARAFRLCSRAASNALRCRLSSAPAPVAGATAESAAPLCSAGHGAHANLPVPQAHGWQAAAPYRCTSCRIFSKSLSSSAAAVRAPVAARNAGPVAAACTCSARPDKKRRRSPPTPARGARSLASVLLHAPSPDSLCRCRTRCKDQCEAEPRRGWHVPTSRRGALARPGLVEDHHCARGVRDARVAVAGSVLVGGRRLWCAGQRRGLGRRRMRSSPLHWAGILPEQPQESLACSIAVSQQEHPGRAVQLSRQRRTMSGKALGCLLLHFCSRGRSRCPRPLPLQCSHSPPGLQSSISSSHSRARSSLDSLTMSRQSARHLERRSAPEPQALQPGPVQAMRLLLACAVRCPGHIPAYCMLSAAALRSSHDAPSAQCRALVDAAVSDCPADDTYPA